MAGQEPNPNENENGQRNPADEPAPDAQKPENKFAGLKLTFSRDLEYVGLLVFKLTAMSLILFIILFNFFPPDDTEGSYRLLRSSELLLTLAATGLVVAIIGRGQNAIVLTIGVFLIGALIVPSKDIVRFALIASGSDKDYESFFEAARSGTDVTGRSTDVANKILNALDSREFIFHRPDEADDPNIRAERRKVAIQIIEDGVTEERNITLLEQVRARGAFETLRAAPTEMKGWVYKYGREEKFIEDIRYLRSEGLIRYAYDDLDTIVVTPLGFAVIDRASAGRTGPAGVTATVPDGFPFESGLAACPADISSISDAPEQLGSPDGYEMTIGPDFQYLRFTPPDADRYQIDVVVDDPEFIGVVDPYVTLAILSPQGDCIYQDENDDGGEGLNSSLVHGFEKQTYLIGIGTISIFGGNAKASVVKESSIQSSPSTGWSLPSLQ